MNEVTIREIVYNEFGKCVEASNGIVDVAVTVDCGPRIIRYGFVGEHNQFCENHSEKVSVGEDFWRIRGGHRLWHSPENLPRTYSLDNSPVEWCRIENGIKTSQEVEPWVQIKKEMEITLDPYSTGVKIVHKLTNENAWPVEFSAWGLTVMAPGGVEIIPQNTRETGLLPNKTLVLWPYSKMNDPRIVWGDKYMLLKQNPEMKTAFKLGITNEDGWAAYYNHNNLFVKKYVHYLNEKYPDNGVSYETFTKDFMLEMESLSPLKRVEPKGVLTHEEEWKLIKIENLDVFDENNINNLVLTHI